MSSDIEIFSSEDSVIVLLDDEEVVVVEVGVGLPGSQGEPGIITLASVSTEAIWIAAASFNSETTNGAGRSQTSLATGLQILDTLDFDQTTQEFANLYWKPPPRWDLGTITFKPHWTAASGTGTAIFEMQAVVVSDGDALNPASGTVQSVTDTFQSANKLHIGDESSPITPGGTPTLGDGLWLRIRRNVGDTLNADAKLLGVELFISTLAVDDAV